MQWGSRRGGDGQFTHTFHDQDERRVHRPVDFTFGDNANSNFSVSA